MCWVCATCRLYVCTVCAQRVCVCVRYCNLYEPCICVVTSLVFLPLRASYFCRYEPRTTQWTHPSVTSLVECSLRASYTVTSLVKCYEPRIRPGPRIRAVYEARTSSSVDPVYYLTLVFRRRWNLALFVRCIRSTMHTLHTLECMLKPMALSYCTALTAQL